MIEKINNFAAKLQFFLRICKIYVTFARILLRIGKIQHSKTIKFLSVMKKILLIAAVALCAMGCCKKAKCHEGKCCEKAAVECCQKAECEKKDACVQFFEY